LTEFFSPLATLIRQIYEVKHSQAYLPAQCVGHCITFEAMKKQVSYLIVLFTLAFLPACNADFDVTAEWKDVTVVYGLLNQNESTHYIKINKAFLGEGDAMLMATEPDSSTYAGKLDVWLEEYDGQSFTGRLFHLDTTTIYNKDSGTFYAPEQIVYFTTAKLDPERTYKLKINNLAKGLVEAKTGLVKPFNLTNPRAGQSLFNFAAPEGVTTEVKWRSAENGRLYQLVIRFHYYEKNLLTQQIDSSKYVDWAFPNRKSATLIGNEELAEVFPSNNFYQIIASKVPVKSGVERYAGPLEFIVYAGADDLSTYIDISKPSNSIVQERPQFSNIVNGVGIFSSRSSTMRTVSLNTRSLDSLVQGTQTGHLSFIKN
jgi:hypothetical protein